MSVKLTLFHSKDYRGATVEDLGIPPAISLFPSTSIEEALNIAYENQFTHLPVINEKNKRLLGILDTNNIDINKINRSFLKKIVKNYMMWFSQDTKKSYESSGFEIKIETEKIRMKPKKDTKVYEIITPYTPLETLSKFFNSGYYFAIITNDNGDLVYGVVTPEDLLRYENSRPKL